MRERPFRSKFRRRKNRSRCGQRVRRHVHIQPASAAADVGDCDEQVLIDLPLDIEVVLLDQRVLFPRVPVVGVPAPGSAGGQWRDYESIHLTDRRECLPKLVPGPGNAAVGRPRSLGVLRLLRGGGLGVEVDAVTGPEDRLVG